MKSARSGTRGVDLFRRLFGFHFVTKSGQGTLIFPRSKSNHAGRAHGNSPPPHPCEKTGHEDEFHFRICCQVDQLQNPRLWDDDVISGAGADLKFCGLGCVAAAH
jgi:hypothetical protein